MFLFFIKKNLSKVILLLNITNSNTTSFTKFIATNWTTNITTMTTITLTFTTTITITITTTIITAFVTGGWTNFPFAFVAKIFTTFVATTIFNIHFWITFVTWIITKITIISKTTIAICLFIWFSFFVLLFLSYFSWTFSIIIVLLNEWLNNFFNSIK